MAGAELRCALIGCGPMGEATAIGLLRGPEGPRLRLLLIDRDAERVRRLTQTLVRAHPAARDRITAHAGEATATSTLGLIKGSDVLVTALSWKDALPVTEFAIGAGLRVAGVGRPPEDPRGELGKVDRACVVTGAGLEPGLTEILARRLAATFGPGARLRLYCGAVPRRPRPPIRHISWYGPNLTITPRPSYRLAAGRLEQVDRFSGVELVEVPGVGVLEAFHDGLLPWFTSGPVTELTQKTLRWPGYSSKVRTLAALGLLSQIPVDTTDGPVRPRVLLDAVLKPHVERRPGDEDVTILAAEAAGTIAGSPAARSTVVVATTDPDLGTAGIGLLTGGVLAATARVLAVPSGAPGGLRPGVYDAHETFTGEQAEDLLAGLRRQNVSVNDFSHPWTRLLDSRESIGEDPDERG